MNSSSHRAKNSAVLTLPQNAGYIRFLLPKGITEVRSLLTRLLLIWSITLWVNSMQKPFFNQKTQNDFVFLLPSTTSLSKLHFFLMAAFATTKRFRNALTRPKINVAHTGCNRRKGPYFGRVFLMLNYTDITQNTYIQSWTVTEIMAIEMCGLLGV